MYHFEIFKIIYSNDIKNGKKGRKIRVEVLICLITSESSERLVAIEIIVNFFKL